MSNNQGQNRYIDPKTGKHTDPYKVNESGISIVDLDKQLEALHKYNPREDKVLVNHMEGCELRGELTSMPNGKEDIIHSLERGNALAVSVLEQIKRDNLVEPVNQLALAAFMEIFLKEIHVVVTEGTGALLLHSTCANQINAIGKVLQSTMDPMQILLALMQSLGNKPSQ